MDTILSEIEAYLAETGMTASSFGRKALGTPNFVFDLRNDGNFTWHSVKRARKFMADNPAQQDTAA